MKNQDKTIALKISSELLANLTQIAKKEDRSISSAVRIAITEYIKKYNEK